MDIINAIPSIVAKFCLRIVSTNETEKFRSVDGYKVESLCYKNNGQ